MNKNNNTKGLTLVEVVVALSILTVVFSGTITLIINIVNLAMMSKQKTEAIVYAQKGLAERISQLGYGCTVGTGTDYDRTFGDYVLTTDAVYGELTGEPLVFAENPVGKYLKVSSTVTWVNKYNIKPYTLSQIIRADK